MAIVSYFKTITVQYDIDHPAHVEMDKIVKAIREGSHKSLIEQVRSVINKEERQKLKKQLPGILFAGKFSRRSILGFESSSNMISIDFDDMTKEDMAAMKKRLSSDPHVISVFYSTSNNGVKAVFNATFDSYDSYKSAFCAIDRHLGQHDKFDLICSDISRGCYMSYDPDIYYNADAIPFNETVESHKDYLAKRRLKTPENTFTHLLKWMDKNMREYKSGQRNEYIYILSAAMCRYGVREETTSTLIANKFTDLEFDEIKGTVESAYRRNDFGIVDITLVDINEEKDFYKKMDIPDDDFNPRSVIINPLETNKAVLDIAQGAVRFMSFGLSALDKYLVLKKNEYYVWVAGSKHGKTQSMMYLALMAAKYSGWKFLMMITENECDDYKSIMVSFLLDKPIKYASQEDIIKALDFIDEHFCFLINDADHLQLLDVYHYGTTNGIYFDAIIIDPITNISKSKKIKATGNEYHEELHIRYLKFSRKYCSIWSVLHLVTSKEREKTAPFVQDGEYGAQAARRCHYGITMFRDMYNEVDQNTVELHVRYNRTKLTKGGDTTTNNFPIKMQFTYTPSDFRYDITVDGIMYDNPLINGGDKKIIRASYPNERIEPNN